MVLKRRIIKNENKTSPVVTNYSNSFRRGYSNRLYAMCDDVVIRIVSLVNRDGRKGIFKRLFCLMLATILDIALMLVVLLFAVIYFIAEIGVEDNIIPFLVILVSIEALVILMLNLLALKDKWVILCEDMFQWWILKRQIDIHGFEKEVYKTTNVRRNRIFNIHNLRIYNDGPNVSVDFNGRDT